ncbi:hypothetical protein [Burkholderia sp. SRS-W-2-2016]|uniref:hypothetical protein n=1 Tax=Burkholderia sp. SRS-W-2-2016 TaxID=1926878 RepID=UPI000AA0511D|nr:hypothetical protein [Burkholderia sp. SRS-W-2-2016]
MTLENGARLLACGALAGCRKKDRRERVVATTVRDGNAAGNMGRDQKDKNTTQY